MNKKQRMKNEIRAAIDIGTNSVRLLVAEIKEKRIRELYREAKVTRLGQGVDDGKLLTPEAMKRTIDVLADYAVIAKQFKAASIIVGATSAARDAKNIELFIKMAEKETGLKVRVLSFKQEANLSFFGAASSLFSSTLCSVPHALVIDIGGGSTELILGGQCSPTDQTKTTSAQNLNCFSAKSGLSSSLKPLLLYSRDIGSVRLTEMFIRNDPPQENELNKIVNHIRQSYGEAVAEIRKTNLNFQTIGVAGTVTTLAAINLGLSVYDPQKIDRSVLTKEALKHLFGQLKKLSVKEKAAIKVVQKGREDVIVAGNLILLTIMEMLDVENLIVSESDILDGLLQVDI